jgi:hypothetical protein
MLKLKQTELRLFADVLSQQVHELKNVINNIKVNNDHLSFVPASSTSSTSSINNFDSIAQSKPNEKSNLSTIQTIKEDNLNINLKVTFIFFSFILFFSKFFKVFQRLVGRSDV